MQRRLQRCLLGDVAQLWQEATTSLKASSSPVAISETDIKRGRQLEHEGSFRKALAVLRPESRSLEDSAVSGLREKHPLPTVVNIRDNADETSLCVISLTTFLECVRRFLRDSAPPLAFLSCTFSCSQCFSVLFPSLW